LGKALLSTPRRVTVPRHTRIPGLGLCHCCSSSRRNRSDPPYTYSWSGVVSGGGASIAFQPQSTGNWTEYLVVTDSNGVHYGPTSCSVSVVAAVSTSAAAKIVGPVPGSILVGGTTEFHWDAGAGVSQYLILAGSTDGGSDFPVSACAPASIYCATLNLPTNPQPFYVTLESLISGVWQSRRYTYQIRTLSSGSGQSGKRDVADGWYVYNH
jgi:hypothetical protein